MKRLFCVLLLLFVFALPQVSAQEVTQVDLIEVEGVLPQHIFPAPDGHHIAYQNNEPRQLCVQDVLAGNETCFDLPDAFPTGLVPRQFFQPLRWSPDSTKIAVVGLPYVYLKDTDLWVVDIEAETLTNLTDDQYEGNLFPDGQPGASIFSEPTWSPDSTKIAVEYTIINNDRRFAPSMIAIVDASTGEVAELSRLPGHTEYDVDAGTVLAFSWSPDASSLAFSLRHPSLEPEFDGLWQIDVTTGDLSPLLNMLVAQAALRKIAPDANIFAVGPMLWSESGMLVWIGDPGSFEGLQWCFWLDMTTGTLIPLDVPMPDNPRLASFMQAVWSPDGETLLLATRHFAPIADETPTPLLSDNATADVSLRLIDPISGSSTLLGYLPFVPGIPFEAVWGPDNNIIIDGYHLTLAE